jgi:hypothetical protein
MHESGVSKYAINLVLKYNNADLSCSCINLLIKILENSNLSIQKSILSILMKEKQNSYFFSYIKSRLYIIFDNIENDIKIRKSVEKENELYGYLKNNENEYELANVFNQEFHLPLEYAVEPVG